MMNQLIPQGFEFLFSPQQVWDAHVKVLKELGLPDGAIDRLEPLFEDRGVEFRKSFPADHFSPPKWPQVKRVNKKKK
jgi:hypothetical protein